MSFTDNKNLASLRFKNGGSIIHHLTSRNDCARLRKVLQAFDDQQRQNILSHMNTSGKTALETAKPYEVRQLLAWSSSQEGFYYLPTPPVVLIMYSTEDRQGAEEERMELSKVFPDFNVDVRERRDLRKRQMLDEIRMAQMKDDISALIVIIMSHGVHGAVCASDGDVRMQDILRHMCAPFLEGKPNVWVGNSHRLEINVTKTTRFYMYISFIIIYCANLCHKTKSPHSLFCWQPKLLLELNNL